MMSSTPESVAEAKRALSEYMRLEREAAVQRAGHGPQMRGGSPRQTCAAEGGSDTPFDNRDDWGQFLDEARESARRYLEQKAMNTRPVRPVDETSPAAVEGRIQALSWLKRRDRSRLKP
jgi:hypothetical protein